jgi:hypothetical protein
MSHAYDKGLFIAIRHMSNGTKINNDTVINIILYTDDHVLGEPGSSGSIVSDYGLDDRAIEVQSLAEAKDFPSSLCVQTGSGAHPASCTVGTGGPIPGAKARPGRDADHSLPSSANVKNK